MGQQASSCNSAELVGALGEAIRLLSDEKDHNAALGVALGLEDELVQHLKSLGITDALTRSVPSWQRIVRGLIAQKKLTGDVPSFEQLAEAGRDNAEETIRRCIENLECLPEADLDRPLIQRFRSV